MPEVSEKWPDTVQNIWLGILPVNLRILGGVDWGQIVVKGDSKAIKIESKYVVGWLIVLVLVCTFPSCCIA